MAETLDPAESFARHGFGIFQVVKTRSKKSKTAKFHLIEVTATRTICGARLSPLVDVQPGPRWNDLAASSQCCVCRHVLNSVYRRR